MLLLLLLPQGCIVIYSSFAKSKKRTPKLVTLNTVCMMVRPPNPQTLPLPA